MAHVFVRAGDMTRHHCSTRVRVALGTLVAVEAAHDISASAAEAVVAAHEAIASVDRLLHPQNDGSDLARIRAAALHSPVAVDAFTWDLLEFAKRLHALTRGVFDPSLPSREGRLDDLELSGDQNAPHVVCRKPVALDFGGFAKGFAVDRAVDTLLTHGCESGLVNAGGDMRVFGAREHVALLRRPDRSYEELPLAASALAVSDVDAASRPPEHQGYYTRVAPLCLHQRYVAVRATTATVADALAKCLLLCPPATGRELLRTFKAECVSDASYPALRHTRSAI